MKDTFKPIQHNRYNAYISGVQGTPEEHYDFQKLFTSNLNDNITELVEAGYSAGNVFDGYHTFNELYHHRAQLFCYICMMFPESAWKSLKHADGTMFKNMFVVGLHTPEGDYSYHFEREEWDIFQIKELEFAPLWDGHMPEDITRLGSLFKKPRDSSALSNTVDAQNIAINANKIILNDIRAESLKHVEFANQIKENITGKFGK